MGDFNLEQYLLDKGWALLQKQDKYNQEFTSYIKKKTRSEIEHTYEFEIHGECTYRPNSIYCKILEKGMYSMYFVLFEGALVSYSEFDVIDKSLGIGE